MDNPKKESGGKVLYNFISKLSPEDKEVFLKSLSEDEKVQFSSNQEEFRQVFDREPKLDFPNGKPQKESDVDYSGIDQEDLQERFDEVMKTFPVNKSIEGLKAKSDSMEKLPKSKVKSLDDLKKLNDPDYKSEGNPQLCVKIELY